MISVDGRFQLIVLLSSKFNEKLDQIIRGMCDLAEGLKEVEARVETLVSAPGSVMRETSDHNLEPMDSRSVEAAWQVKAELEVALSRVERDLAIVAQGLGRVERDLGIVGDRHTNTLWQVKSELEVLLERLERNFSQGAGALAVVAGVPSNGIAANLSRVLDAVSDNNTTSVRIKLAHPFANVQREAWVEAIELWLQFAPELLESCEPRVCPTCCERSATPLFTSYDGYPFVECDACSTWYVPLAVNAGLFKRYFEICPDARRFADYMLSQDKLESVVKHDRARFEAYYSHLRVLAPKARLLLDIGCSVGTSLDVAAEHGFEAIGVEVSEAARAVANAKERCVYATTEELPERTFDVITLWESLEHIDAIEDVLSFVAERLSPDGLFAVTVPNLDSPILRTLRADSFHINGGAGFAGHINLFDKRTLALLLERFGFEVVEAKGQYSMNLVELVGYHTGAWRGARDYLERDHVEIALPSPAVEVLNAMGPVVARWEADYAMAPILKVIARRRPS